MKELQFLAAENARPRSRDRLLHTAIAYIIAVTNSRLRTAR
jgi:hypothetical protein